MGSVGNKAFQGQGRPRDEEMASLKRELIRVRKERDFLKEAVVSSTGRCNTFRKFSAWRHKSKNFSWPCIEL
jgi:hypothetical protein